MSEKALKELRNFKIFHQSSIKFPITLDIVEKVLHLMASKCWTPEKLSLAVERNLDLAEEET